MEDALAPAIQRGRVWLAKALDHKDRMRDEGHMKERDADVYEGDIEQRVQLAWDSLLPPGGPGPGLDADGPDGSPGSSSSSGSSDSDSD